MANAVAAKATAHSCRNLIKPSPFLAPVIFTTYAACRDKNVIGERFSQNFRASKPSVVVCNSKVLDYPILSSSTSSQRPQKEHATLSTGIPISQVSSTWSPFLGRDGGVLSQTSTIVPRRRLSPISPRAAARDVFGFRLPVITEKPEWWWRTLACIPYLIALQISDVGFYLQPFSEHYECFENLIYFVPGAITRFPTWFTLVYCYFAYIGIVKNKEWPHFFRFHLMMGMLLETALQIVWYTCNFMPLIHYNGTFGMHFWAGVGFAFITVLLQCIRCALAGSYVHLPLISDAAFIHTLFNIGGYHRPF